MARPRPTYNRELVETVLERLAEGETLREVAIDMDFAESTFRLWALDDVDGLAARYARARQLGAYARFDALKAIADDGSNDWMEKQRKDGSTYWGPDHEHIARSKLRIDTERWALSKMLPKEFGDKLDLTTEGEKLTGDPADVATKAASLVQRALARKKPEGEPDL